MDKKHKMIIKTMSKARIGMISLILGILIFSFGIKYTETCIVTAIIGIIMFFTGLWMIFMKSKKDEIEL